MSSDTLPERLDHAQLNDPTDADGKAFFELDEGGFRARPHARSPWSTDLVHGRLVAGLMAREALSRHRLHEWQPTRMTTDLMRPIPMNGTIRITTEVRRLGGRLQVIEVLALTGEKVVACATIQALRPGEYTGDINVGPTSPVEVIPPDEIEVDPRPRPIHLGEVRRLVTGHEPERRFTWFRDRATLIDGEMMDGFVRVAAGADWVSPFSSFVGSRLAFINADFTFYLHRLPVSEWIGFEIADYQVHNNVALSTCNLYDTSGRIGTVACAALPE